MSEMEYLLLHQRELKAEVEYVEYCKKNPKSGFQ